MRRSYSASARKILEPNHDHLKIFIEGVFRHCDSQGVVSLRTFAEDDSIPPIIKSLRLKNEYWFATDNDRWGLGGVVVMAAYHAGVAAREPTPMVFCPPVATFKPEANGRAREEDIFEAPGLSVELDKKPRAALETLERILGPATVVVRSGGIYTDPESNEREDKLHVHWRLKKPARDSEISKLKEARRLATGLVGGDASNVPVCHPIRWPGSWHRKGEPRLCEIIESRPDNQIDLDDALSKLKEAAPEQEIHSAWTGSGNGNGDAPQGYVADVVSLIPNPDLDWADKLDVNGRVRVRGWNYHLLAIYGATGGEGKDIAHDFSRKSKKYNEHRTDKRWEGIRRSPPDRIGIGTLEYLAGEADPEGLLKVQNELDRQFLALNCRGCDVELPSPDLLIREADDRAGFSGAVLITGTLNVSEAADTVTFVMATL